VTLATVFPWPFYHLDDLALLVPQKTVADRFAGTEYAGDEFADPRGDLQGRGRSWNRGETTQEFRYGRVETGSFDGCNLELQRREWSQSLRRQVAGKGGRCCILLGALDTQRVGTVYFAHKAIETK